MTDNVLSEYYLCDRNKIILLDGLGMESLYGKIECAQNIYLLDMYGATIWQVSSDFDYEGNPFTSLPVCDDGSLSVYRWDSGNYTINDKTGVATPVVLMK
ncbi:hypothetical protein B4900_03160 [Yersinia rohdei]|nr:hypothetical protein B4900_03160 [Yersinia rohdei]